MGEQIREGGNGKAGGFVLRRTKARAGLVQAPTLGASLTPKHQILNVSMLYREYRSNVRYSATERELMREEDVECIPGSPVVKSGV